MLKLFYILLEKYKICELYNVASSDYNLDATKILFKASTAALATCSS